MQYFAVIAPTLKTCSFLTNKNRLNHSPFLHRKYQVLPSPHGVHVNQFLSGGDRSALKQSEFKRDFP
jgi:hypothetical protein